MLRLDEDKPINVEKLSENQRKILVKGVLKLLGVTAGTIANMHLDDGYMVTSNRFKVTTPFGCADAVARRSFDYRWIATVNLGKRQITVKGHSEHDLQAGCEEELNKIFKEIDNGG